MAGRSESILTSANATFVAELYRRFLEDSASVDAGWAAFFHDLDDDARGVLAELEGASWAPNDAAVIGVGANGFGANGNGALAAKAANGAGADKATARGADATGFRAAALDSIRALMLVRSYRVRGHLEANLDPLGLVKIEEHPELNPKTYGFGPGDLDRPIFIDHVLGLETATLRTISTRVRETYCGSVGVEYMHIQEPDQKAWVQERIEATHNRTAFSRAEKIWILEQITRAESFEHFLDKKYTGTKRFGLEGGEATIAALEAILRRASELGVEETVLGMPHRGRLNVLANVMAKPFQAIFSEFEGQSANPDDVQGSGDVKYHLGTSSDREFDGRKMHLSLTANPSHLEAVDPVVLGKVRAKQQQRGDLARERVLGILLHGDAAFAGQGLVAETLGYYDLKGYRSGGTIHLIVNNQIGFTTSPSHGRSSPYCSDVAKLIQAPILHVNGDDPEAVVHVARMAVDFRQRFHKDVVIDLFCYRRHGHNEADEPSFTQPLMYRKIASHPTTRQIYAARLMREDGFGEAEIEAVLASCRGALERAHEAAKTYKPNKADWLEGSWAGFDVARGEARRGDTAVPIETLRVLARKLCALPEGFEANRKLVRIYQQRLKTVETGEAIDWATAESLALGALAVEGSPVRFSGQDCGRGTFSQRHAVAVDQQTEERYLPLAHLAPDQAPVEICDSPLAEASVLGFEYGYSLADPRTLVIWEAQFGDFANGAQVIIDQFVAGGEAKWLRMSGLVMLLPHGYEGQGPEHSSAKLERYLQLSAEDNLQVVNLTTPANYFHALRRQVRRNFRKPLVIMTPKSLLRHKSATSKLEAMAEGSAFHRVLWDRGDPAPDAEIKRVVLCSGKVYYDLIEARAKREDKRVYVLRVEQLYPFPHQSIAGELARWPNAEIVWCQEEPRNMGGWTFVEPRIEDTLAQMGRTGVRARYVGRAEAASPATGSAKRHAAEQAALVAHALTI